MRIAIIDDEALYNNPQYKITKVNIFKNNDNIQVVSNNNVDNCDSHADKCIKIIYKYLQNKDNIEFVNIIVKGRTGGSIDCFLRALEIIPLLDVDFLCLPLGTVYSTKKKRMHNLIKIIAKKRIVIVCAISNTGEKTYPACFKEVIKCQANKLALKTVIKKKNTYELCGAHIIHDNNNKIMITTQSNSFAAAYMTSLLVNAKK